MSEALIANHLENVTVEMWTVETFQEKVVRQDLCQTTRQVYGQISCFYFLKLASNNSVRNNRLYPETDTKYNLFAQHINRFVEAIIEFMSKL